MCTLCCWDVSLWPTLVNYTNLAFFWILIIVSLIWVFDLSCLCCFPAKWLYFPTLVYIGSYARYLYVSHWVSVNLFLKEINFLSLPLWEMASSVKICHLCVSLFATKRLAVGKPFFIWMLLRCLSYKDGLPKHIRYILFPFIMIKYCGWRLLKCIVFKMNEKQRLVISTKSSMWPCTNTFVWRVFYY